MTNFIKVLYASGARIASFYGKTKENGFSLNVYAVRNVLFKKHILYSESREIYNG